MKIYKRKIYYLIFAVAFYILWFLYKLGGVSTFKLAIPSTAIDVIFSMITLYVTVEILLPRYIYREKYLQFSLTFLSLVLVLGSAIILSQLKLAGSSITSYSENISKYKQAFFYWFWSDLIFGSYFLVTFISLVGYSIRMAIDKSAAEKKMETLEKEKIMSELLMLKHQINPHFLFNALNTVYYKIDKSNTSARKIMEQFSSLLRYQLYECNVPAVPVDKEIEFLSNYIEVQRQRLNDDFKVECIGFNELTGFNIAPYLLIPLVENCFKHVSRVPGDNTYIMIECGTHDGWFRFKTKNSISNEKNAVYGGIGLSNIRKRLEIMYPEKHILSIEQNEDDFNLTLELMIA
jgi:two-component system, LytTR family, sensor kinase